MFTTGLVNRQAGRLQHAQAMHIKAFARLGQRQPSGIACQQGHAQLGLKALDIEADHSTGLPQQICGTRQGTGLNHRLEGVESIEADHR